MNTSICGPPLECTDGMDNDADGLIDCADPGFQIYAFCRHAPAPATDFSAPAPAPLADSTPLLSARKAQFNATVAGNK